MASPHDQSQFPATRWTEVVRLCQSEDENARRDALAGICRDYWYPLYAFARRLGHNQHDAEDFTQDFFGYVVKKNVLATASRELGKLRTFLLAVFQRHIRDTEDRQRAKKRGGGEVVVSLEMLEAEELYRLEPTDLVTPESLFERSWALHVLRGAVANLRQSQSTETSRRSFEILAPFLDPEDAAKASFEAAARDLGISIEAVRQGVSRMRRKFRDFLRRQIAATLNNPNDAQIDDELSALQAALRG